eukprot:m.12993 g.12993  ORF g.12993 m.12993 type:complete len:63 (+) comp18553_c0_seq1:20-208(+)
MLRAPALHLAKSLPDTPSSPCLAWIISRHILNNSLDESRPAGGNCSISADQTTPDRSSHLQT